MEFFSHIIPSLRKNDSEITERINDKMDETKTKFANLLTETIYRIKFREDKNISVVQDELGYALGKEGGASIEHWRKGHTPSKLPDLENLAQELVRRQGIITRTELEQFLLRGGHPHPSELFDQLSFALSPESSQKEDILISDDGDVASRTGSLFKPLEQFDPQLLETLREPGGTVSLSDKLYVERKEDDILKRQVRTNRSIVTIRAPRQTGKSSLLVRGLQYARQYNIRVVRLDLQGFDNEHLRTREAFLRYLAEAIVRQLRLNRSEVENAWDETLGPQDNLTYFMEDYILPQSNGLIILAIDEADKLLQTDYYTDFFGMIRAWHNLGAHDMTWEQLNIILVISTEPFLLIADMHQSPFNVGLKLHLKDFGQDQVSDLNQRHGSRVAERDLPAVMRLFNGHPYLTRKAFYELVTEELSWPELERIASTSNGPFADHLNHLHRLLLDQPGLKDALKQVLRAGRCTEDEALYRLWQGGLIKGSGKGYMLRCELYEQYFKRKL